MSIYIYTLHIHVCIYIYIYIDARSDSPHKWAVLLEKKIDKLGAALRDEMQAMLTTKKVLALLVKKSSNTDASCCVYVYRSYRAI